MAQEPRLRRPFSPADPRHHAMINEGLRGRHAFDRGHTVRSEPKRLWLARCAAGGKLRAVEKPWRMLMLTLCIRYTLDANKLAEFEAYARALPRPVERCGGRIAGYYLPTKIAGPTNTALGLIEFPNLAAYQQYRDKLAADPDAAESLRRAEATGCILNEERSFIRRLA